MFVSVIIKFSFVRFFSQYEDSGALDIFLTPSQKAWFKTLKKAANKKPKKMISRPQVSLGVNLEWKLNANCLLTFLPSLPHVTRLLPLI